MFESGDHFNRLPGSTWYRAEPRSAEVTRAEERLNGMTRIQNQVTEVRPLRTLIKFGKLSV